MLFVSYIRPGVGRGDRKLDPVTGGGARKVAGTGGAEAGGVKTCSGIGEANCL